MKKTHFFLLVIACIPNWQLSFSQTPQRGYDVHSYEMDLDIDIVNRSLRGKVDIQFTALIHLETLHMDLYRNLEILGIYQDSIQLEFDRQQHSVFIQLKQAMTAGSQNTITIYYQGRPQEAVDAPWSGGMVWQYDNNGLPWIGVACQTEGPGVWWPVKDDLMDEPDSMLLRFTIPQGLSCISNGRLLFWENKGEKNMFVWKVSYPINVYNVSFYIGDFRQLAIPYQTDSGPQQLDFFVLPYHVEVAKDHFHQTVRIMQFFERTFGEYPWWRDGYKLIESPYSGMEHQTAIAYGSHFQNEKKFPVDYIILHETAHEWWGNSVTVGDFRDIWIQEGFATYCEALYIEEVYGERMYQAYIEHLIERIQGRKALSAPTPKGSVGFQTDVYCKGAVILHTLRDALSNDSLFFDILQAFYQENKYSITSSQDWIDLVNRKTGKDYGPFFDLYLNDTQQPLLEWNYVRKKKKGYFAFNYRWNTGIDSFYLPIEIVVDDQSIYLTPSKEEQIYLLERDSDISLNPGQSYFRTYENFDLNKKLPQYSQTD